MDHIESAGYALDRASTVGHMETANLAAYRAIAHALIAIAEELRSMNQRAEDELEQRDIERAAFHKLWQAGPDGH